MRVKCFVSMLVLALWLSVASAADGVSLDMDSEPGISQEQQLKELRKEKRRSMRGFATYIDVGYLFELNTEIDGIWSGVDYNGERLERENASKFAISGSCGYRFNNFFFLGAGVGFEYYRVAHFISVPIFADVRVTLSNTKVAPIVGVKLGGAIGSFHGAYFELAPGLNMKVRGGKSRVSCSLVYSMQLSEDALCGFEGLGFKFGYEF